MSWLLVEFGRWFFSFDFRLFGWVFWQQILASMACKLIHPSIAGSFERPAIFAAGFVAMGVLI
jgi:hypothetical protein